MNLVKLGFLTVALAVTGIPAAAQAQTAEAEALGKCVQLSSNGKDRILTARWLISALGSAPEMQDMVTIDPALKQQTDVGMAALFTRLLTVDCLAEARAVFRHDATGAGVEHAFGVLGEIAVQELFGSNPAGLETYAQYLNEADFEVLRD